MFKQEEMILSAESVKDWIYWYAYNLYIKRSEEQNKKNMITNVTLRVQRSNLIVYLRSCHMTYLNRHFRGEDRKKH